VRELVRNEAVAVAVEVSPAVVYRPVGERGDGHVFLATEVVVFDDHVPVFFPGVGIPGELREEIEHLGRLLERPRRVMPVFRVDVIHDRDPPPGILHQDVLPHRK
jgi:hypothetical protein